MSDNHESEISVFKEITGQQNDVDVKRLLAICQWDVEHAINVFFMRKSRGHQSNEGAADLLLNTTEIGQESENANCAKMMPSVDRRHWTVRHNGTCPTDNFHPNNQPESSLTRNSSELKFDHEQMLKENEINEMLEKVRQPFPPTQGILLKQNFHETYRPMRDRPHDPVFEQFAASSSAQITAFEQLRAAHHSGLRSNTRMDLGFEIVIDGTSRFPPTQSVSGCGTSNQSENCAKTQRSLKNLYRPPIELMFRGDWDQALELAKKKKMWLLVNVQNALEFASAKLNRDIWSSETVQEIIKTNFIFWQVYHDSSDGSRIRAYYGLNDTYPIIFIVDPRTGEEVQRLVSPPVDESFFLDLLTTFLAENSTFESRDRQFAKEANNVKNPTFNQKKQQQLMNGEQNNETSRSNSSSGCWTPAQLSTDEWTKWTVNELDIGQPNPPDTVQLSLRLPNGQTERILLCKTAPLSAVFSLLLAKGHHSPNNYQLVLDYPRREFMLSNQNCFSTLDEIGFGPQELIHINTIEED